MLGQIQTLLLEKCVGDLQFQLLTELHFRLFSDVLLQLGEVYLVSLVLVAGFQPLYNPVPSLFLNILLSLMIRVNDGPLLFMLFKCLDLPLS